MENDINTIELQDHKQLIRKNAFWLFWGQVIGRLLRVAVVIIPARILTQESWGAFNYALSIATFLTVFSDVGLNALLTREASRNPSGRKEYISTAFFIKLAFILVVGASFIFLSKYFMRDGELNSLLLLMMFVFVFDSLRDLGIAIARATEKMAKEGINNILTNFFIVTFGVVLIYLNRNAVSLGLAYALGTGLGLLSIIYSLRNEVGGILSNFNRSLVRHILISAWPFGLIGLMGTVMINTDIFIIGWLKSLEDVALYSAPQKIVQLLYIAPALISTAFFPALAKYVNDRERFANLFETALATIFLIAVPLTLGGIILADPILGLIYGADFSASKLTFMILASTMVIVFPSVLIGNAIFAHDKQKGYILYCLMGVVGNILLDLALIPIWGIEGAAIATLINQLIITIYAWYKVRQLTQFNISGKIKNILLGGLAMAFAAWMMNFSGVNVLINIVLSGLIYLSILIILKEETLYGFWALRKKSGEYLSE